MARADLGASQHIQQADQPGESRQLEPQRLGLSVFSDIHVSIRQAVHRPERVGMLSLTTFTVRSARDSIRGGVGRSAVQNNLTSKENMKTTTSLLLAGAVALGFTLSPTVKAGEPF